MIPFQQLDSYFQSKDGFTHYMSPRGEELMKIIYGAPNDISVEEEPVQPPSPNTSIKRAAKYVLHEKAKKFVPQMDSAKTVDQVYAHIVTPMMEERNERAFQQSKEKSVPLTIEPYQQYWFTSESVQDVRKEIRNIQLKDKAPLIHMEEKFNDAIMNVICVMKHEKMIDCQKTQKKLRERMKYFVHEVRKCRVDLFNQMLTEKIITYEDLNNVQKKEFIAWKPPEKKENENAKIQMKTEEIRHEVDAKLIQQINASVEQFPPSYRFSYEQNQLMTKELLETLPQRLKTASETMRSELLGGRVAKTPSVLSTGAIATVSSNKTHKIRIMSSQLPTRKQKLPEETKRVSFKPQDIYQEYWNSSDPLAELRMGPQINPRKYFTEVTSSLVDPVAASEVTEAKLPEALTKIPDATETYVIESKVEEKEKEIPQFNTTEQKNNEEVREVDPGIKAVIIGVEKSGPKTHNDMNFLLNQTVEITNTKQGEKMFDRLNAIWTKLGFTMGQKLEMAAKYSQNVDESQKLSDAVTYWENAEDIISRYQNTYRSLKDFLKFEIVPPINARHPTLKTLSDELKMIEGTIITFANQMKEMYGDDLILNRRKIVDVIPYREEKLKYLIKSVVE
ncbi:hypothetical protein TVAG_459630 [Trichomonas vaginalis G3]|uniref:Uncharacterized protein n=1 Tax=Trichomonas vaginalis (strain ATCC PRA-98 / G3) TaxID=412133 RepID=A2FHM3_TRIV3|nr:coiled-coil domain-containing protein 87 family [Trichomonas vaginalis G3]EAX95614.1 hypothetical protein TVAG_459630 [Trichomonas vaginalis G3]KAI5511942.1 coiled-coil domain-containing protein 87 family [Trichomonas vaginalis G3]|eukprot:XP_001308544.1 hypothetical protein [Trichomonas vaginalis G3]